MTRLTAAINNILSSIYFASWKKKINKTHVDALIKDADHSFFLNEALNEARQGLKEGGIPIGSVLVLNNTIIGRGHNRRVQKNSSILHAEMDCLENAGRLTSKEYRQCIIYSTLSPCDMCSGAILLYKIPLIVIGENLTFKGPEQFSLRRGIKIINMKSEECVLLMKNFIKNKPQLWNEDIGI